jgi:hypothetical protein
MYSMRYFPFGRNKTDNELGKGVHHTLIAKWTNQIIVYTYNVHPLWTLQMLRHIHLTNDCELYKRYGVSIWPMTANFINVTAYPSDQWLRTIYTLWRIHLTNDCELYTRYGVSIWPMTANFIHVMAYIISDVTGGCVYTTEWTRKRAHTNPHRDVLLPSNVRYERRIGYSLEIQNVVWSYFW